MCFTTYCNRRFTGLHNVVVKYSVPIIIREFLKPTTEERSERNMDSFAFDRTFVFVYHLNRESHDRPPTR